MTNNPYKQFASILNDQMAQQANSALSGVPCELGTITGSGLKLDTFKHEMQDYLVADWLVKISIPAFSIFGTQSGLKDSLGGDVIGQATFSFEPTVIDRVHIEFKPDLKPGDRVLCVPVNGGQDVVIVSKVVS